MRCVSPELYVPCRIVFPDKHVSLNMNGENWRHSVEVFVTDLSGALGRFVVERVISAYDQDRLSSDVTVCIALFSECACGTDWAWLCNVFIAG